MDEGFENNEPMDEVEKFYLYKSIAGLKLNQNAQNTITYLNLTTRRLSGRFGAVSLLLKEFLLCKFYKFSADSVCNLGIVNCFFSRKITIVQCYYFTYCYNAGLMCFCNDSGKRCFRYSSER